MTTTTRHLGVLTIGQAPRADDTTAALRQVCGRPVVFARAAVARGLAEVVE